MIEEIIMEENRALIEKGKLKGKAELVNSLKQKMGKKGKIEITLKDLEELISQTSQKVG